jgi:hypothetical protein
MTTITIYLIGIRIQPDEDYSVNEILIFTFLNYCNSKSLVQKVYKFILLFRVMAGLYKCNILII